MIQHQPGPPAPPHRYGPPPAGLHPAPAIPRPRTAPDLWAAPAGLLAHAAPMPEIRIRPRLLWAGLSWLLFAVLVLAGVAMSVIDTIATGPHTYFGGGEVTTLELDPATDPVIYAALEGGSHVRCEPVGPNAGRLDLAPVTDDRSVRAGGRVWHAAFDLAPAVAGSYRIVCDGPGATFAFGDQAETAAGGAAVALIVLPLVGLTTAVTTTIVVLARRRAARNRLFAPWTGQVR